MCDFSGATDWLLGEVQGGAGEALRFCEQRQVAQSDEELLLEVVLLLLLLAESDLLDFEPEESFDLESDEDESLEDFDEEESSDEPVESLPDERLSFL